MRGDGRLRKGSLRKEGLEAKVREMRIGWRVVRKMGSTGRGGKMGL